MTKTDQIQMMMRCREEILTLRAQIGRLQPKAEAYDNLGIVLNLLPKPSIGYGEDLAWKLEQEIKKVQASIETEE